MPCHGQPRWQPCLLAPETKGTRDTRAAADLFPQRFREYIGPPMNDKSKLDNEPRREREFAKPRQTTAH